MTRATANVRPGASQALAQAATPTRRHLLATASLWLAGCATRRPAPGAAGSAANHWSGRLALRIDSEPPQSFAALFELKGGPGHGELKLSTPLGNTLGLITWSDSEALLQDGSRIQRYDSIALLLARVTGADFPVDALFDWLNGRATTVPGWRPQLAQVREGRLQAMREAPAPTADLRLIFEPAGAESAP